MSTTEETPEKPQPFRISAMLIWLVPLLLAAYVLSPPFVRALCESISPGSWHAYGKMIYFPLVVLFQMWPNGMRPLEQLYDGIALFFGLKF